MFELSGVNYDEVLEQGDSILVELSRVRVIGGSSYRGFELSGVRVIGGSSYQDYTVYIMFGVHDKKLTGVNFNPTNGNRNILLIKLLKRKTREKKRRQK